MTRSTFLALAATAAAALAASVASAQEATLRVHHFMPERSTLHEGLLEPWAARLEAESDGRIEVQLFAAMALGGAPPGLYDQAVDGAVDVVLTLPGYTAGRFPVSEAFELPFMMEDPVATSRALWAMIDADLQDAEFEEVQVLAAWVHGPGVLHTLRPVARLEDLAGMELRGPSRLVTDLLGELGATPVGMPLPAIPENISRGVIDGAVVPWEIVPAIRLQELVGHHTELGGPRALYTARFVLAMNLDAYDALPDDLRALIDATTGAEMSAFAGALMADADAVGRASAAENAVTTLDAAETARWEAAAAPVYARYVEMADDDGFDGQATIDRARALIAANR